MTAMKKLTTRIAALAFALVFTLAATPPAQAESADAGSIAAASCCGGYGGYGGGYGGPRGQRGW